MQKRRPRPHSTTARPRSRVRARKKKRPTQLENEKRSARRRQQQARRIINTILAANTIHTIRAKILPTMADANAQQPRPLQMGAKGAYIVRLLMVGDSACGKTSLVLRFDQNVFSTKFVTTIGVDYRDKMVKVR